MSDTNVQDGELRELLREKLYAKCYRFFDDPTGTNKTLDELLEIIAADKRKAVEAVLDRLISNKRVMFRQYADGLSGTHAVPLSAIEAERKKYE